MRVKAELQKQKTKSELQLLKSNLWDKWHNTIGWTIKEMETYNRIINITHTGQTFDVQNQMDSTSWENAKYLTSKPTEILQTAWIYKQEDLGRDY